MKLSTIEPGVLCPECSEEVDVRSLNKRVDVFDLSRSRDNGLAALQCVGRYRGLEKDVIDQCPNEIIFVASTSNIKSIDQLPEGSGRLSFGAVQGGPMYWLIDVKQWAVFERGDANDSDR